ncbi:arrestin domain-containing protein 17 isoform X2 [Magallana gigas]|uniref:arrestin domain-containing protein 17 isoform X2 n=1 Tax=Magallana gigas TaxID=29159 RepID=UPI0033422F61
MGKKLRCFRIDFDNPQAIYFPGQPVNGKVIVDLESETKVNDIKLRFLGEAYVYVDIAVGNQRRKCESEEEYFDNTFSVIAMDLGDRDEYILKPGLHTFPFSFVLPLEIPSSLEGEHGHVRYIAKGTIDRSWSFNDHTKRAFTVIGLLDLNKLPLADREAENSVETNVCCLCCKSGPIKGTLRLNRIGYVPGESVFFDAYIENKSSRVCGVSARLYMVSHFIAVDVIDKTCDILDTLPYRDVPPGGDDVWTGDRFIIPPVPPSSLPCCKIIKVEYYIMLMICPSGPSLPICVKLDIIIGNIPLQSAVQQYQKVLSAIPSVPSKVAMLEPSYNEYIKGPTNNRAREDDKNTQGQLDFTPSYTYFNWT